MLHDVSMCARSSCQRRMRTICKTTETHTVQASWQAKSTNRLCENSTQNRKSSGSTGSGSSSRAEGKCCETVNMSRANLQPRAMCSTSTSVRPSSKVGIMPMSANKRRKLLSVLCSSSSDEVKSQQGHMAPLQRT